LFDLNAEPVTVTLLVFRSEGEEDAKAAALFPLNPARQ
jgi:hypothetical protein